jgi:molecular chaperone GrpE
MPEHAPPNSAETTAFGDRSILTPESIDGVLLDFGDWLRQAAVRVATGEPLPAPASEFSWQSLVAEFTALRQEVHLQTRNSRTQLEQNATALEQLDTALDTLDQGRKRELESSAGQAAEAAKPLLKTLVDVFDALALAKREVERVRSALAKLLDENDSPAPSAAPAPRPAEDPAPSRPWWPWRAAQKANDPGQSKRIAELEARATALEQELNRLRDIDSERRRALGKASDLVNSILTGYSMGLERIERAAYQHGLNPIACVGETFDPECMEAVEVVAVPGQDGTMVLEEVRRGYRLGDRVFRYAQVRVARPG